jgi:phosphotriesterase-related protein
VDPDDLGPALTHEHVLVDFIGADKVSPARYDADEVFAVMLPYLLAAKAAGIGTIFECTPNYLGRDPSLLKRLSVASGVNLVTNTGLYKDPFLPQWAKELTAAEIAERWIAEATEGIGPEGIRPGFIKIAANEGPLSEIQHKIVRAAALASRATGLVIASHTTTGVSALEELDVLEEVGVPAKSFIWVHADAEPDATLRFRAAERGAWLSYDGIREGNAAQKVPPVTEALRRCPDQLLISQDAGWYHVGEAGGGDIAPLDWLPRELAKLLLAAGSSKAEVDRLLVRNPARAFVIRQVGP